MKAPVTTSGEETRSPERSKTHTPVLPREEIKSNIQALSLFIPVAIKYIIGVDDVCIKCRACTKGCGRNAALF